MSGSQKREYPGNPLLAYKIDRCVSCIALSFIERISGSTLSKDKL
jgi:hypothetical protein